MVLTRCSCFFFITASLDDDDLDDLLDITTTYSRSRPVTTGPPKMPVAARSQETQPSGSNIRLPPASKSSKGVGGGAAPKGSPATKSGPPRSGARKDEEWLDSVLGM